MRIPDNTLYLSRIRSYGTAGLPADDMVEQTGCPAYYKAKYVEQRIVEPPSYPQEYGSMIHDTFFLAESKGIPLLPDALQEAWGRTKQPLGPDAWAEAEHDLTRYLERPDDGLATLVVEQELRMPLMEYKGEEWFVGGFVDRIMIDPNDERVVYVDDLKTNRAPPARHDVDNDPQYTLYMLLVRHNLPQWLPHLDPDEVEIIGRMDAIKWYTLETRRENWQLDSFLDFLRAMARRIIDDEEGAPVLNDGCSWCPIKFDCKEFRKLPGKGRTLIDRMSTTTDLRQRVLLLQQAQQVEKAIKAIVADVKGELMQELLHQEGPMVVNGVEYDLNDQWETEIDRLGLFELMGPNEFLALAKPTQESIKEWVQKHPEHKATVDSLLQRVPKGSKRMVAKVVTNDGDTTGAAAAG